jgi:hypothetical protein
MSAENGTIEPSIVDAMQAQRARLMSADSFDAVAQIEIIYQLWWRWADFHVFITTPVFEIYSPPHVILPERLDSDTYEFVYPIMDYGDRFSTSKGLDSLSAGLSMWKLYCTIEKIIALLIERLKTGGVSTETEVQIAFAGHELAQRKGFESVINLSYNVVVTNFDPGVWGERYLQTVKRLADKGYGYPSAAPRDLYRRLPGEMRVSPR